MQLVDTHAHFEEIKDLNQVVNRAEKVGVTTINNMGSNQKSNELVLCVRNYKLYASHIFLITCSRSRFFRVSGSGLPVSTSHPIKA